MPTVTIRDISEAAHRAVEQRAARNGRSTEAELREIIEQAGRSTERPKLGTALAELGRRAGLQDDDLQLERHPAEPPRFE